MLALWSFPYERSMPIFSTMSDVSRKPADYFDDVASETGYGGRYNVYTAASYGLTEGALVDGRRLADCDSNLTREQAAKMMCALVDALEKYTGAKLEETSAPKAFADGETISPWARESVDRASALGLLKGDEAGRFWQAGRRGAAVSSRPGGGIRRSEPANPAGGYSCRTWGRSRRRHSRNACRSWYRLHCAWSVPPFTGIIAKKTAGSNIRLRRETCRTAVDRGRGLR